MVKPLWMYFLIIVIKLVFVFTIAEIELSDQSGNPKDLREHLHRYASEFLRDKEVYVLLQVESKF